MTKVCSRYVQNWRKVERHHKDRRRKEQSTNTTHCTTFQECAFAFSSPSSPDRFSYFGALSFHSPEFSEGYTRIQYCQQARPAHSCVGVVVGLQRYYILTARRVSSCKSYPIRPTVWQSSEWDYTVFGLTPSMTLGS